MYRNVNLLLLVLTTLSVEGTFIPKCPFPNGEHPEYFPHEDCRKFWQCSNGIPYLMHCAKGTYYNPDISRCECAYRGKCKGFWTTPSTDIPETTEEDISRKCLTIDSTETVYYPDEDCSRYWKCSNGFTSAHKCPRGLLFNSDSRKCDKPENVICKSQTSLAPSTASTVPETTDVTSQISLATTSDDPTSISPTEPTSTNAPSSDLAPSSTAQSTTEESLIPTDEYATTDVTDDDDNDEETATPDVDIFTPERCIPSGAASIAGISPSTVPEQSTELTDSTSPYTNSEYSTTSQEDFGTSEAIPDERTDDSTETTTENYGSSVDSNEDDQASFSREDEIITTQKTTEITSSQTTSGKSIDELIAQVCQNLPEDQFYAAHPFDCSKYLFCSYGKVTVVDCIDDYWYDPLTRKCEYANQPFCIFWRYEREILMYKNNLLSKL